MKTLIAVLVLLAFLQTTLIPINLVLIVIILRAYIKVDLANLWLTPILYLVLVNVTHLLAKSPLSKNIFSMVPLVVLASVMIEFLTTQPFGSTPRFLPRVVIEGVLSLPIYLILKVWEDRFVVRSQIKLKMR